MKRVYTWTAKSAVRSSWRLKTSETTLWRAIFPRNRNPPKSLRRSSTRSASCWSWMTGGDNGGWYFNFERPKSYQAWAKNFLVASSAGK